MSRLPALIALPALLLLAGCSRPPLDEARLRLAVVDLPALRQEAALVYKQIHSARGPEYYGLKQSRWPETFKKLKPLRVGVYRDGIAFALGGEADAEWGIHVYPQGVTHVRETDPGRFEKLADGAYFYHLGD